MNLPRELFPAYYQHVRDYFALHLKEFAGGCGYDEKSLDEMKRYYHYPPRSDLDSIAWFWIINSVALRVAPVLRRLQVETLSPVRVLDAGCGLGGYSFLFAHHGANVTGIDINADRLAVAEKRKCFFNQRGYLLGTVQFQAGNILNYLEVYESTFDVIWVNDAISHIYPPMDFLFLARRALKPCACIVISDSNVVNPLVYLYMRREQHGHSCTQRLDPATGQMVSYGVERFLSVPGIAALLRKASFQVSEVIFHSLVPPLLRNTPMSLWLFRADRIARRVPLVQHLSGGYTIVAANSFDSTTGKR